MSTVLVVAAHGYGNVGDDICAHSGEYIVKKLDSKHRVIITSPPYNPVKVHRANAVILSGGGIIYDRVAENVDNYLQYLEYGLKKHYPTVVMGVGVQGIVTERGKERYREVLNQVGLVTTRSPGDKAMLDEVGVKNVITTQDLGFLADEWVKKPFFKPRLPTTTKPRLGLVLLDVRFLQAYKKGNQKLRRYIKIVEKHLEQIGKDFDVWLFAHSKDDEDWRKEMAARHQFKIAAYKNIKDFARFYYLYQQMDLIVGVRFHSVILGLLAAKPVVGIGSEGAKLFRLASETPTLAAQCYSLGKLDELSELFANLRTKFDAGVFKVLPAGELKLLKAKAAQNVELLGKVL